MWVSWFRVRLSQPRGMLLRMHAHTHTHTYGCTHRTHTPSLAEPHNVCICTNTHTYTKHRFHTHTHSHTLKASPLSLIRPLMCRNLHSTSGLHGSGSCMAPAQVRGVVRDSHFISHIWGRAALHVYASICCYPLLNSDFRVAYRLKAVLQLFHLIHKPAQLTKQHAVENRSKTGSFIQVYLFDFV